MSAPRLPITTPGRAEYTVTRGFLARRSTTTLLTAACFSRSSRKRRIFRSSCRSFP